MNSGFFSARTLKELIHITNLTSLSPLVSSGSLTRFNSQSFSWGHVNRPTY